MVVITPLMLSVTSAYGSSHPEEGCRRNLQVLFEAFEAYRKHHNGTYPPSWSDQGLWPQLIAPYLAGEHGGPDDVKGPFYCPAVPTAQRRAGTAYVSYGYNCMALGAGPKRFEAGISRHHKRGAYHLVHTVPDPANTVLLVDSEAVGQPGDGWYKAYPGLVKGRHGGKALVLFCDGRIEAIEADKLNVGPPDTIEAPWHAELSTNLEDTAPDRDITPGLSPPETYAVLSPDSPDIDGQVSPGEWDHAPLFCGFKRYLGNTLTESDDMIAAVSCSPKHISVLFIMPVSDAELVANVEDRDGHVWHDDSVEVILQCGDEKQRYHFTTNSKGTRWDSKNGHANWDGDWTAVSTVREPTPALQSLLRRPISNMWIMEVSIPLTTLGVDLPTHGTTWRLNLCRNGKQHLVFAPTFDSHAEYAKFARLTFLRDAPRLQLLQLGSPSLGEVSLKGRLVNLGDKDVQVKVSAVLEGPSIKLDEITRDLAKGQEEIAAPQLTEATDVNVDRGQSEDFVLTMKLNDDRFNRLKVQVIGSPGTPTARVLYANDASFNPGGPLKLTVRNYPSYQRVDVVFDRAALGEREGLSTKLIVFGPDSRERLVRTLQKDSVKETIRIKYAAWPQGPYQVKGLITTGDGKKVAEATAAFTKLRRPDWLGSDLGISNEVLPPWTPIEYSPGNVVRVWGREVQWGKSLLPERIRCREVEILTQAMRVVIATAGKTYRLTPDTVEFTRKDKNRCEIRTRGKITEGFEFISETWMEYDGLFWTSLKLLSAEKREITSLKIEVPLKPQVARYRNEGAVKTGLEQFQFTPVFNVGDVERGLSFACESLENWSLDYGRGAIEIDNLDREVVFRLNLINKPCTLKGEKRYSFGFHPLPVKPLPRDWHSWRTTYYNRARSGFWPSYAEHTDVVLVDTHSLSYMRTRSGPTICNPMAIFNDDLGRYVKEVHEAKTLAVPFLLLPFLDNDPPTDPRLAAVQEAFLSEWMQRPLSVGPWSAGGTKVGCTVVCLKSSYQDCLAHVVQRMIKEYGIDGVYLDGCGFGKCQNLDHGCGWQDENGIVHPTYSILATRRILKRIYTLLHQAKLDRPESVSAAARHRQPWLDFVIWGHASGAASPPVHSFITLRYDGEQFLGVIQSKQRYQDLLSLDSFRAEFVAMQTGIQTSFLAFAPDKTEEKETHSILSYLLPHGVCFTPTYLNPQIVQKVLDAQIAFGTRRAEFVPSWRTGGQVKLAEETPDVLVAYWHRADRYLVVVSNIGDTTRNVSLRLPPDPKGREITVREVIEDRDLGIVSKARGSVALSVRPFRLQMLLAEPRR